MIELGNLRRTPLADIGRKVAMLAHHHGEVALFVGRNCEAVAGVHHESGYQHALDEHGHHLVGRYRVAVSAMEVRDPPRIGPDIAADIACHAKSLGLRV